MVIENSVVLRSVQRAIPCFVLCNYSSQRPLTARPAYGSRACKRLVGFISSLTWSSRTASALPICTSPAQNIWQQLREPNNANTVSTQTSHKHSKPASYHSHLTREHGRDRQRSRGTHRPNQPSMPREPPPPSHHHIAHTIRASIANCSTERQCPSGV
jgi:hypothetical protein